MTFENLINGQYRPGQPFANINPSDTSETVGMFCAADVTDVNDAILAARNAFPGWADTPAPTRAAILYRAADELMARKAELGELLAREEGKTRAEGEGEIGRAALTFRYFAGECLRPMGEILPDMRAGVRVELTHAPVGVIGMITPWNFPMAIPAWKIAPALAYGNCVVFKPAELVPGCAWHLVDILKRSGLPDGVLNLVMGKGRVVGQAMIDSLDLDAISFTGSEVVGSHIALSSAQKGRRYQLEMGGKNATIVLDDADIPHAADCIVQAAYFSTGQRCTATSRIIATKGIYNDLRDAILSRMDGLVIGHALAEGTDIGPVVDERQFETNRSYVGIGKDEGATLHHKGTLDTKNHDGFYMQPVLFSDADNKMRLCQEEIFGPVAALIPAADYDDAIEICNDSRYGLSGAIMTSSPKYANRFKHDAKVGMAMVNCPSANTDFHAPFGGCKSSSFGPKEQGPHARDFFTTVKTSYTATL
ncbi:aldehyde dehydrogenase family protein [Thalassospira sp. MA62]|nr:aldehyde dehydrogenase family protein [Thalassospira sp. MA62]